MKKAAALLAVLGVSSLAIMACGKTATTETSAPSTMAAETPATMAMAKSKLPIPPAKLPSMKVAAGEKTAGAQVFAANCESCHGAKGVGGGIGPRLVASGLKAGQIAFMVRKPTAVDKTSSMPALQLTDKQVADVAAYVASLK